MEAIKTLYFSLWASILDFPVPVRVIIILGVMFTLIWRLRKPWIYLMAKGIRGFLLLIYLILNRWILPRLIKQVSVQSFWCLRLQKLSNLISGCFEKMVLRLDLIDVYAFKGRKRYLVVSYILCVLIVISPHALADDINDEYRDLLGKGSDLYLKLEEFLAGNAHDYAPLLGKNSASVEAPEIKEIWLTLSKQGRGGANIRESASMDGKILKVVRGEDRILFLNQIETYNHMDWVMVRTSDGINGWISKKLVEGLPE